MDFSSFPGTLDDLYRFHERLSHFHPLIGANLDCRRIQFLADFAFGTERQRGIDERIEEVPLGDPGKLRMALS